MSELWKSPRKIEEEITQYKRERFEAHMSSADRGEIDRETAIQAIREELGHIALLDVKVV